MTTLGVLVPCRNEATVLPRRLANLAASAWPASEAPHRIVVVDDGSEDGTAELAREHLDRLLAGRDDLRGDVIANTGRPGKAGALEAGLAALGGDVEVVVLTDADVIGRPDALMALASAFARRPSLGMACASQEFVRDLAGDGTPRGANGGPLVPAGGLYDRWTAVVRAVESRSGRLFSVHGQLLAWRAALHLHPTPGIAADDLDLMRQVRQRGLAVVKLAQARFLEVKTPPGPDREAQRLRRARAYVQVIRRCRLPAGAPWPDRLQFALYRRLPLAAPTLGLALLLLGAPVAVLLGGRVAGFVTLLVLLAALFSPPGRRLLRLLTVIARARRLEAKASLADRWEMARS